MATEVSRLLEIAGEAWAQALADTYFPPLPEVHIEHDQYNTDYFYIDSNTWKVHLNLYGMPHELNEDEARRFIRSVCHHEIQHYLTCPYDGVTNGFMFAAARRHVNDEIAMCINNIFSDLVIDGHLLRRYPDLTRERIERSISDSAKLTTTGVNWLWRLIVTCYNKLYGVNVPEFATVGKLKAVANKVSAIVKKYSADMNKWPLAVEKIAKLIKEEREDKNDRVDAAELMVLMGDPTQAKDGTAAGRCMEGDYKTDEELMEELMREADLRGGNLEEVECVMRVTGFGGDRGQWLKIWYRVKAKNRIKFEANEKRHTGSLPISQSTWRLGDPLEDLDFISSLTGSGIIIPNMTTRKWEKKEYHGTTIKEKMPDLLIVIDSSGSMSWDTNGRDPKGRYHTALMGAFAAMELALKKGNKVAAINFSSSYKKCDWTRERRQVEDILLHYYNGGTTFPTEAVERMLMGHSQPILILMVTDAEVSNMDGLVRMVKHMDSKGHHLTMFRVGSRNKRDITTMQDLANAGASVISVENHKDLDGLIVREVRGVYFKNERLREERGQEAKK